MQRLGDFPGLLQLFDKRLGRSVRPSGEEVDTEISTAQSELELALRAVFIHQALAQPVTYTAHACVARALRSVCSLIRLFRSDYEVAPRTSHEEEKNEEIRRMWDLLWASLPSDLAIVVDHMLEHATDLSGDAARSLVEDAAEANCDPMLSANSITFTRNSMDLEPLKEISRWQREIAPADQAGDRDH